MEKFRFKEEVTLIQKEMANFISFYKDHIIPNLKERKEMLKVSTTPRLVENIHMCVKAWLENNYE